ncbi:MAG: hypothetical protein LBQ22_12275 [Bacteroidales bacterium]|jgi:hypothetical protein|nr:hypothetical protein [Bacteroidales bacterium]
MNNNFELAKKEFKERVLDFSLPIKMLSIGSNSKKENVENVDCAKDLDLVIVVNDSIDCYEYSKKISSILKKIILDSGVLITAYPIKEEAYLKGESEFLDNVRKNGIEI